MLGFMRTALCIAFAAFAASASAQNYPSGPVKLIVPIPAGGVTDVMARIVGQRLQEIWGQTVVVENRPGGNSGVGAQAVERSPPDGLTLLVAPDSTFTANPALFSKLIYDPDGFTPISVLCRATPMLMAHPSLPVKTVSELDRLRQGQSRQAQLRLVRYRHLRPSQHGGPQAADRDGDAARAISRGGAGFERPLGQRGVGDVAQPVQRRGTRQGRKGEVDCGGNGNSGFRPCRTCRRSRRRCPASRRRSGSGCGGRRKCRLSLSRKSRPTLRKPWNFPRPGNFSKPTASSASISRRRISASSFKAISGIGAL